MDLLNHMDALALSLGYTVMAVIAVSIMAGAVIGAARLSNRAQYMLLNTMGGWNTFLKYRRWYHQQQKTDAPGESD